jgi:hypothetical protein
MRPLSLLNQKMCMYVRISLMTQTATNGPVFNDISLHLKETK